ncbi:hypothetical protein, partial [Nocardia sp. NPDC057030]
IVDSCGAPIGGLAWHWKLTVTGSAEAGPASSAGASASAESAAIVDMRADFAEGIFIAVPREYFGRTDGRNVPDVAASSEMSNQSSEIWMLLIGTMIMCRMPCQMKQADWGIDWGMSRECLRYRKPTVPLRELLPRWIGPVRATAR